MIFDYLIIYLAILATALAQLFLKIGAVRATLKFIVFRINTPILFGFSLMGIAIILNIRGLRNVPLRDMAFILPTTYIVVPLLSFFFLKENLSIKYVFGTVLIVLGTIIFNIPLYKLFN